MACEKCSDPGFILSVIYGQEVAAPISTWLNQRLEAFNPPNVPKGGLDRQDVFLITHADQFSKPGMSPLQALDAFTRQAFDGLISGIHLLPFYESAPGSSSAVIDPRQVDPALGSWQDIESLAHKQRLVMNLVMNHVSFESPWLQGYLKGEKRYKDYFLSMDPQADLSIVVRPDSSPLLTHFDSVDGDRWLWSTFGPERVDLNFSNPAVMMEWLDILLEYVQHGASMLCVDSAAYLGKEMGTRCVHRPQAHLIVRLLRAILDKVSPGVLTMTDPGSPTGEFFSYFGNGYNETHLLQNEALSPILLHTFMTGCADKLTKWVSKLHVPSMETAFYNALAYDAEIRLESVRSSLSQEEIQLLVDSVLANGGSVELDGNQVPSRLKIDFYDALNGSNSPERPDLQVNRFLSAQAVVLSLAGLPAVFLPNLLRPQAKTSSNIRLSQQDRLDLDSSLEKLQNSEELTAKLYQGVNQLLKARSSSSAFRTDSPQLVVPAGEGVFGLLRFALYDEDVVCCLNNVTAHDQTAVLDPEQMGIPEGAWKDLITGKQFEIKSRSAIQLSPYQTIWLIPVQ